MWRIGSVTIFSRRVQDFCNGRRSFPTDENSTFYRRGRRRWILLIANPLNGWAPVPLSKINMSFLSETRVIAISNLLPKRQRRMIWRSWVTKEFPVIYNRACADYKDRNIKNNARRKISELLDLEESKRSQRYERSNSLSDRRNSENSVWNWRYFSRFFKYSLIQNLFVLRLVGFCFFRMENLAMTSARTQIY